MPISMYRASVPLFAQTLTGLEKILDKAEAHCAAKKIDPAALLNARLYPDMFTFTRQVQTCCDFAKNGVARLAGTEAPKISDDEKSFAELKARVAKTLEIVNSFKPEQIDGSEERDVTYLVAGQPVTLKGEAYLTRSVIPNFYFHATTAYDILRHNGVEIGKLDFLNRR